jgi:ABC-type transporter Mla subunit MlaD
MIVPMESLSFMQAVVRFPGALVRLPSSAQATLEAVNDVAERMDRLMAMLERLEGGVDKAGAGIDFATIGISTAVAGVEQAVGMLDASLPSLSDSASALRILSERLSGLALDLASELPKATRSLQEVSPALTSMVGLLDQRFTHIDTVVTELAELMEATIGTIPGMRRVLDMAPSIPFQAS